MILGFAGNYKGDIVAGATEPDPKMDNELRIGISMKNSYTDLSFEEDYHLTDRNSEVIQDISPGRYRFYKDNGGIKVVDRQGSAKGVFEAPLFLEPVASPAYEYSFLIHNASKGSEYRGLLEITGDKGSIIAANVLDIEYYLKGVVPCEMPTSWGNYGGMEALKAQAVAARTYAIFNKNERDQDYYNVCDTEYTQVYGGKEAETDNTDIAVEETKGELLQYNGSLIQPYYYATSGGYTERSENVWSTSLPYLKSVHDPYDDPDNPQGISNMVVHPHARWKATIPASSIAELMQQNHRSISGDVEQVIVASNFSSGRVEELRIVENGGAVSFFKEEARYALGLRSQHFTVEEDLKEDVWVASSITGSQQKKSLSELEGKWIAAGTGKKEMLTSNNLKVLGRDGSISQVLRKAFVFKGKGWGHGVGMSQNGAYNRSRDGHCYQEILSFYYPGTSLTKNR